MISSCSRRCSSSVPGTQPQRSYLKPIITSVGCGIVAGSLYAYYSSQTNNDPTNLNPAIVANSPTLKSHPPIQISRKVRTR